jgi:hypothetical protein
LEFVTRSFEWRGAGKVVSGISFWLLEMGWRGREIAESGAYEAGVEGAGEGDVGGALNETTAVGEESEGVGWAFEAEEEIVEAEILNIGVGDEAVAHGGEVYGTVVLVDLDGVAAAEGDVRTALS